MPMNSEPRDRCRVSNFGFDDRKSEKIFLLIIGDLFADLFFLLFEAVCMEMFRFQASHQLIHGKSQASEQTKWQTIIYFAQGNRLW